MLQAEALQVREARISTLTGENENLEKALIQMKGLEESIGERSMLYGVAGVALGILVAGLVHK